MNRMLHWMVAPVLGTMVLVLGCVSIDPADAQQAIQIAREMRQIQQEEVQPLIPSLDQLLQDRRR